MPYLLKIYTLAEWVMRWAGDRVVMGSNQDCWCNFANCNFGNSVYPALAVSFGGDTKKPSVPSIDLMSMRGELKDRTQGVKMCNLSWTPPL